MKYQFNDQSIIRFKASHPEQNHVLGKRENIFPSPRPTSLLQSSKRYFDLLCPHNHEKNHLDEKQGHIYYTTIAGKPLHLQLSGS